MQQRIVELISCVSNESVTEELLHVNDDLNNIFLRYDRSEHRRHSIHKQLPSHCFFRWDTFILVNVCPLFSCRYERFRSGRSSAQNVNNGVSQQSGGKHSDVCFTHKMTGFESSLPRL